MLKMWGEIVKQETSDICQEKIVVQIVQCSRKLGGGDVSKASIINLCLPQSSFSPLTLNPTENSHRLLMEGTGAMLMSALAYKKRSPLQHSVERCVNNFVNPTCSTVQSCEMMVCQVLILHTLACSPCYWLLSKIKCDKLGNVQLLLEHAPTLHNRQPAGFHHKYPTFMAFVFFSSVD